MTSVTEAAARLGAQFEREIREQPEAIRRQIEQGREAAEAIATEIRRRAPHTLLIAARGSSDNAGRYAQYVFGVQNRRLVSLAAPSLFTLYRAPPDLRGTLVLGVSQSGRSPDIVAVLEEARRQNVYTVAITRDPRSPLAQAAEQCLLLHAGEEQAIAATKSYTCQLVALAMLSTALADDPIRWQELWNLPDAVQETLDMSSGLAEQAARFRQAERFIVIGRGYNFATAFEISLKIQEASYAMAEPYSAADFWHGPAAMVDRGLPVLLVAPSGEPLGDFTELRDLCVKRRADLIAITRSRRGVGSRRRAACRCRPVCVSGSLR